jgi:aminopeptidase YwaD
MSVTELRRVCMAGLVCVCLLSAAAAQQSASVTSAAQKHAPAKPRHATPEDHPAPAAVCRQCIRATEEFMASDAMHGRGSGTHDEEVTATYIGSELRRYGIEPAGDNGGYVQSVNITQPTVAAPPVVSFTPTGHNETRWTHGQQVLVLSISSASAAGPLQKIATTDAPANMGAVVLLQSAAACGGTNCNNRAVALIKQGAAAVLMPANDRMRQNWAGFTARTPRLPMTIGDEVVADQVGGGASGTMVVLSDDALKALDGVPAGTAFKIETQMGSPEKSQTWNALGILRGSDVGGETVLLSAHLDHLGIGNPVNGDSIYNGADDDASGCAAVLELARVLGSSAKPSRTVVFAFFGSEEKGGFGSTYFLSHPPVPLAQIVANLEFEMIGRADPAVAPDQLWLTGYDRSDLGPTLAQHGAKLVADPHPGENFFQRSDNIVLARKGVVAQTVSSFGLHPQYHQPSDDLAHLDLNHMYSAIESMLEPVRWLVNSNFKPQWLPGKKP